MTKRRYKPEEIIRKLREAEVLLSQDPAAADRPATAAEALSNDRMYLFDAKGGVLGASLFEPSRIPPTWGRAAFPLPEGATSGEMAFSVPADPWFRGKWVFGAAFRDLATGQFVNSENPVEVSNEVEVR